MSPTAMPATTSTMGSGSRNRLATLASTVASTSRARTTSIELIAARLAERERPDGARVAMRGSGRAPSGRGRGELVEPRHLEGWHVVRGREPEHPSQERDLGCVCRALRLDLAEPVALALESHRHVRDPARRE